MSFARYHEEKEPGFLEKELAMLDKIFPETPPTGPIVLYRIGLESDKR